MVIGENFALVLLIMKGNKEKRFCVGQHLQRGANERMLATTNSLLAKGGRFILVPHLAWGRANVFFTLTPFVCV